MNTCPAPIDLELNYLPELPKDRSPGIGCVGAGFIMADCHLVAYRNAGFNPVVSNVVSDTPAGIVTAQDPEAFTKQPFGSTVVISVSLGPPEPTTSAPTTTTPTTTTPTTSTTTTAFGAPPSAPSAPADGRPGLRARPRPTD